VQVTGTSRQPRANARLAIERLKLGSVRIGSLSARGKLEGQRVEANVDVRQQGPGRLTAALALDRSGAGRVDAKVTGKDLDLAPLSGLPGPVAESSGRLQLELAAAGPLAQPRVHGHVRLRRGAFRLRGMSPLTDVDADIRLQPNRVTLSQLKLRAGGGTLSARGAVGLRDLRPTDFSLRADAAKVRLDIGAVSKAVFSGRVDVGGELQRGALAARIRVSEGELRMPEIQAPPDLQPTGPLPDVVFVDRRARAEQQKQQREPPTPPIKLALTVSADPLFIRGEELDLEVYANVRARTDARQRIRLKGEVGIRRGRVELLGNRFEVQRARVTFSDQAEPDPALNIVLSRKFAETTIYVGVEGTASDYDLILRSDPAIYDRSQIISLIVVGRLDPRGSGDEESDRLMAAVSGLSQILVGGLMRAAARKVGIDVARIALDQKRDQQTGETTLRAEAEVGKYLTRRLYLGYRRVFGASTEENANEALLEYRISARWLLMALFGDAGVGGLDLLWTYRY